MVAEPRVALRERLRMRADRGDALERVGLAQQVVADVQARLADDREGRRQEEVERARDDTLARVLDRDDAEVGAPALVAWNTSSALAHGSLTIDEPK
jgi:hypothetical protein